MIAVLLCGQLYGQSEDEILFQSGVKKHLAGDYDGALEDLEACLVINPEHEHARESLVRIYMGGAMVLFDYGEYFLAKEEFKKAQKIQPQDEEIQRYINICDTFIGGADTGYNTKKLKRQMHEQLERQLQLEKEIKGFIQTISNLQHNKNSIAAQLQVQQEQLQRARKKFMWLIVFSVFSLIILICAAGMIYRIRCAHNFVRMKQRCDYPSPEQPKDVPPRDAYTNIAWDGVVFKKDFESEQLYTLFGSDNYHKKLNALYRLYIFDASHVWPIVYSSLENGEILDKIIMIDLMARIGTAEALNIVIKYAIPINMRSQRFARAVRRSLKQLQKKRALHVKNIQPALINSIIAADSVRGRKKR